ncbi:MAG: hypothetical protein GXN92_01525 [Candidatus Micrarchaeota archaeon]|nr:hypothetical protein [Candidatus Micrarchaeota archaeon]
MLGLLSRLLGREPPPRYKRLVALLSAKINPEFPLEPQLRDIASRFPEPYRRGALAFVRSGEWKKYLKP